MICLVFGSNRAGRHGKGAALHAVEKWGASYGQGEGRQGNSYAIPTKDDRLHSLSLEEVEEHIITFLEHTREHKEDIFLLTPIGCGLAKNSAKDIATLFKKHGLLRRKNVVLTNSWLEHF